MNDYGFDYMNYLTNIPNDMKDMSNSNNYMNQMNKETNMNKFSEIMQMHKNSYVEQLKKMYPQKENNQILEPYEGLIRGNMFGDSYEPYKNYKPAELEPNNEREALLYQVMQYRFALIELNLYLDTHPNDRKAIELYNKYSKIAKEMSQKYESMYGPLTLGGSDLNENRWEWINSPWPWEVM